MEYKNFQLVRLGDIRNLCYFLKREFKIDLLLYASFARFHYYAPNQGPHSYAVRVMGGSEDLPDLTETEMNDIDSDYIREQIHDFLFLFWRYDIVPGETRGKAEFVVRNDAWREVLGFVVNYNDQEFYDILDDSVKFYREHYRAPKPRTKIKKRKEVSSSEI